MSKDKDKITLLQIIEQNRELIGKAMLALASDGGLQRLFWEKGLIKFKDPKVQENPFPSWPGVLTFDFDKDKGLVGL